MWDFVELRDGSKSQEFRDHARMSLQLWAPVAHMLWVVSSALSFWEFKSFFGLKLCKILQGCDAFSG